MKVLDLPLTLNLGIEVSDLSQYLLKLGYTRLVCNHLGSIHASASYTLAETTAGYLLNKKFADIADGTIPLLRSSKIKYHRISNEDLYSTAKFKGITVKQISQELEEKKKVLFSIEVRLYTHKHELVFTGEYTWFVTLKS